MKNKKIFTGNYYICKKFAMILIVLIVFAGCGQNRITEKEEKKETVESEMNAEVKKTAQTFRSVYMKEKSELNTLKVKRKIINCLEEKGYAAVDCDNQIDMVNREKVEDFCKTAEKEEVFGMTLAEATIECAGKTLVTTEMKIAVKEMENNE